MSSPRLLLIGTFPDPKGGISIHLQRLKAVVEKAGFICTAVDEARLRKASLPNLRRMSPVTYVRTLLAAEIVHIHTSNPLMRLAHVVAAKILRRRVIVTVHSLTAPEKSIASRLMYKLSSRLADVSVFVSEHVRKALSGTGPVIPAFLPPAPHEEQTPDPLSAWIRDQQSSGRSVLVSNASRLNRHRGADLYGLDMLIDLFSTPEVNERFACLFMVSSLDGCEEYFEAAQRRIAASGMASGFRLISQPVDFAGLMKLGDIFVRATNTDGDALSVREALWYGKRVIASDCAERPAGSILFKTRDTDDLRQKLLGLDYAGHTSHRGDFAQAILDVYRTI